VADLIRLLEAGPRLAASTGRPWRRHHVICSRGHATAAPIRSCSTLACTCGVPPCPLLVRLCRSQEARIFPKKGSKAVRILRPPSCTARKRMAKAVTSPLKELGQLPPRSHLSFARSARRGARRHDRQPQGDRRASGGAAEPERHAAGQKATLSRLVSLRKSVALGSGFSTWPELDPSSGRSAMLYQQHRPLRRHLGARGPIQLSRAPQPAQAESFAAAMGSHSYATARSWSLSLGAVLLGGCGWNRGCGWKAMPLYWASWIEMPRLSRGCSSGAQRGGGRRRLDRPNS